MLEDEAYGADKKQHDSRDADEPRSPSDFPEIESAAFTLVPHLTLTKFSQLTFWNPQSRPAANLASISCVRHMLTNPIKDLERDISRIWRGKSRLCCLGDRRMTRKTMANYESYRDSLFNLSSAMRRSVPSERDWFAGR
jgi:hypothetical protein